MSSDDHDDESHPDFLGQKYDEFNSKIMVTAVVSLTFVIFLVVGLHIYVRYALRRQARSRAAISQFGLTVAHARASEPPTTTGLDPAILVALPSFVFKPQQFGQAHEDRRGTAMDCPVCLSNLEVGEMARLLPNCKHVFHLQCIDKWLIANPTCPICRTEAEPQIKPEPREGPVTGLVCGDNRSTPSAPVLDDHMSISMLMVEGASDGGPEVSDKMNRSNSRLSSFRRMLSRERSLRRIQPHSQDVTMEDLERQ